MPSCVISDCKNNSRNSKKSEGITYHRFLRPDHKNWELWVRFVQKKRHDKLWRPTVHSHICSAHFQERDKRNTKTGRIFLNKTAVPYDKRITLKSESGQQKQLSLSYQNQRILQLKRIIIKERNARKRLACKLKKTQRQNRYLKKKCESYKSFVNVIKQKYKNIGRSDQQKYNSDKSDQQKYKIDKFNQQKHNIDKVEQQKYNIDKSDQQKHNIDKVEQQENNIVQADEDSSFQVESIYLSEETYD